MEVDKQTIDILANLAKNNKGLLFMPGNVLMNKPESEASSPIIRVDFASVTFPKESAVYDLTKLLSILNMFSSPNLEFDDKQLLVSDGEKRKASIRCAARNMISAPDYSKGRPTFDQDVQFSLSDSDFKMLMKAVGAFSTPEISISGDGEHLKITTWDSKNSSNDKFEIIVGEASQTFTVIIDAVNLSIMLPRTYTVTLTFRGLIQFESANEHNTITYWIAASEKSKVPVKGG